MVHVIYLFKLLLPLTVAQVLKPEDIGLTEADCKSGYANGPDCCTYYQCTGLGSAVPGSIRLIERRCVWPLVWNKESCTCDWDITVPECINDPCQIDSIVPTTAECPGIEDLNTLSECCVDGIVYTKVGNKSYIKGNELIPQDCPGDHEYMLESCSCEHVTGQFDDRKCLLWDFEKGFTDINQGIPAFAMNVQIAKGEGLNGGNAARFKDGTGSLHIAAFQKGYFGRKFTIGMSVKDESGDGGTLFDNGGTLFLQLADGILSGGAKTVLNDTLDDFSVPYAPSTGRRRKKRQELGDGWGAFAFSHGSLKFYINGELIVDADQPLAPVQGTGCALTIGARFTGLIDNFYFCPFDMTAEEIKAEVGTGILPTRDGNLNVQLKSGEASNGGTGGDGSVGADTP